MRILVYGHSQSWGYGIDLAHVAKKLGHTVKRVTRVGWSDRELQKGIPAEIGEDPAGFDRVYYVGGANPKGRSKEQIGKTILENVATLGGPSRVTVLLVPYFLGVDPPDVLSDKTLRGWHYENELRKAGIPVYRPLFSAAAVEPDKTHLKAGTKEGREFAAEVLAGGPSKYCQPIGAVPSKAATGGGGRIGLLLLSLPLLALWYVRRRRR